MPVPALMRHTAHSLQCYWASWFPVLAHVSDQLGHLLSEADFTEMMFLHIDYPSLHGSVIVHGEALSWWRRGVDSLAACLGTPFSVSV